jgi:Putative transposase of IS4/5 family (DUF4096)
MLPNKPRGIPGVDDRRILNGIFWVLRSGAPWRDLPDSHGPPTMPPYEPYVYYGAYYYDPYYYPPYPYYYAPAPYYGSSVSFSFGF